jgi:dihydroorotase
MRLLIKNGRVVDPSSGVDDTLDVLIEGNKIVALDPLIASSDCQVIDASRLVVAPGFIDLHVHVREPGQEYKEDIQSASAAAARGGFASICAMPNTQPVNDEIKVTKYILAESRRKAAVNVFPIAAITRRLEGKELTDLAGLADAGAVAFSDDGRCVQNSELLRQAIERASRLNSIIIEHCEDHNLSGDGVMHEGPVSRRLGFKGIPASAEDVMVARDLILAGAAQARIHIAHLSTRGAVDIVRTAKKRDIRVTAEATPHHLTLTDEALVGGDPNLKVNPPLRSPEDVQALRDALAEGVVDALATDHAPHAPHEKSTDFGRAPFGIAGLETAVSLLLDKLVQKNIISLSRFIEMISTAPARILGLQDKGRLAPGADADLTILNLHKEVAVDVQSFVSKSRNNPFDGWKLRGAPVMTIVGGKVVFSA